MNIEEMTREELLAVDEHTMSTLQLEQLKKLMDRLERLNKQAAEEKANIEHYRELAKQTVDENIYELPKPITVAWLADDDGKSQFVGMKHLLEGVTTPIHVKKYTRPGEMRGLKHDLVLVDFGGVGETYGELVYMDYCDPVRKLIEENPNTLFMFMTTWTSRWLNIYLETELKSDMRAEEYTNTVHKKNDFGTAYKPLHTTDWGKAILDWFGAKTIVNRVPAYPQYQKYLEDQAGAHGEAKAGI